MTDNEIIKALKCCMKAELNEDCKKLECPFFDYKLDICKYIDNEETIYANALDLINRQKAEISVKRKLLEKAEETINRQQAEIDNWEKQFRILDVECSRLEKKTEEQQAEIERLDEEEEKYPFKCVMPFNSMVCSKSIEDYERLVGDIGAEAIKEFAERLKEKAYIPNDRFGISEEKAIDERDVDNLVKEMVGEE